MKDNLEFLAGLAGIIAVTAAVVATCCFIAIAIDRSGCTQYGELTGQPVFYSAGTGCLVKRGDEWVTYNVAVSQKHEITVRTGAQP
ncbi:hypothetical protein QPK31_23330 [Massilia sp. YIM B02769]|uniref:hypothetical protein n=1 Tax=Massilia sp. YIM B02769 TaxID=3050129 RepID=UPI0025B66BD1|nr:hypothetical protein [Massilia sp. YIM B02769]MDN4061156.1 hypothetical protein [Massilia sp. YIM B02769]